MRDFATLPKKHYTVIYADPPWRFESWSDKGEGKSASQHYDVMTAADICALPVSEIAADDAVLFLWVIQPMLPEALKVIEAWGFKYKTVGFVWVKMCLHRPHPKLGLGYHTRSSTEQCWLATRGEGYVRHARNIEQCVLEPPGEHSRKPVEVADRISRLVGTSTPRIELFARGPARRGWHSWGREAKPAPESTAVTVLRTMPRTRNATIDRETWDEMWGRPFDYTGLKHPPG